MAPLTGLPGDYGGRLDRPALVVKIDNGDRKARPQVGLNQADVVYEERVEGSVTRLARRLPLHRRRAGRPGPLGPHVRHRHLHAAATTRCFAWSGRQRHVRRRDPRGRRSIDVGYDALSGEYFREPSRPRARAT